MLGRRKGERSASGLCQRFPPESAAFFRRLLEEPSVRPLPAEESVPTNLLKRFQAVMLEDRCIIVCRRSFPRCGKDAEGIRGRARVGSIAPCVGAC
jgi:hypothetical protein